MAYVDGYGLSTIEFGALAKPSELVNVSLAYAVSSEKIRVYFDRGMTINAALTSKYNYTITPVTAGAVEPYIKSVEYEYVANPTYIDLIISETTNGATYNIEVNPDGPIDLNGEPIDPDNNSINCVCLGVSPYVKYVIAVGKNRVDIVFSEPMLDNEDIRNINRYNFDNGLSTLSVLDVEEDTVKIVTSDQIPGTIYNLTILTDAMLYPVVTNISGTEIESDEQDVVITGSGFASSGTVEICDNSDYNLSTIKITQSSIDSYTDASIQLDIDAVALFS